MSFISSLSESHKTNLIWVLLVVVVLLLIVVLTPKKHKKKDNMCTQKWNPGATAELRALDATGGSRDIQKLRENQEKSGRSSYP